MSTGDRMKQRRKALDLSAEDVAAALDVSPATIYRYEKGDIEKVPITVLAPLSELLLTTPQYLMGWTDDPSPPPTDYYKEALKRQDIKKLISAYEKAEPLIQQVALEILESHPKK